MVQLDQVGDLTAAFLVNFYVYQTSHSSLCEVQESLNLPIRQLWLLSDIVQPRH
ncbi:Uncharacterised protein [Vibrio cholerae]|nr:Uncharacterised protein [Vibrio cholerae]